MFAFIPSYYLDLVVVTVEGVFWQARVCAGRSAGDEASKLASDCFAFLQFHGGFHLGLGG